MTGYDNDEKKKNIALNAFTTYNEDNEKVEENEEMVLLAKRYRKFMNSKKGRKRNFKRVREVISKREKKRKEKDSTKKDPITCYEFKKLGRIRMDYRQLMKMKKSSHKPIKATWDKKNYHMIGF